jgi:phosphoribosylformimino-5-aminoimidazole carboxamide ribotide isomerase
MFIIPSMSLDPDPSRSYASALADAVREWDRAGFPRVQLTLGPVDQPVPAERILEDLFRDLHSPFQLAGRFEATEEIDGALAAGADFVVLGPRGLDEFDWLTSVSARFPGQLLLSSPARERRSRLRGALRTLPLDLRDIASEAGELPLAGLIVVFGADAIIGHSELGLLEDVTDEVQFPVLVSTGTPDLATLRDLEFRGVTAAVIHADLLSASFDGQTLARSFSD